MSHTRRISHALAIALAGVLAVTATGAPPSSAAEPARRIDNASISGTVTGPGGTPIEGLTVEAYVFNPDFESWEVVTSAATNAAGAYTVANLAAQTYHLGFQPDFGADLLPEFFDNAATVETGTDIPVGPSQSVTGKNAQLAAPSHITGTVTAPGGAAVENADVTAYTYNAEFDFWETVASASTSATGSYDVSGLAAGTYHIGFAPPFGTDLLPEFFDNAATVETGTDIVVGPSTTVAGRNAQLAAPSHITGTVTAPGGAAVSNAQVTAYTFDEANQFWDTVTSAQTNAAGAFDLGGLAPDTYHVGFEPPFGTDLLPEFFDNAATVETGTDIVVGASTTVAGRNALLARSSHITGTVTAPGGGPVVNARVTAYTLDARFNFFRTVTSVQTNAAGAYDIGGLTPGTYRIGFDPDSGTDLLPEFFDNARTVETGTDIVVGASATVTGRNAQLATPSHITGTVTDTAGAPIAGIRVTSYTFDERFSSFRPGESVTTGANGAYDVGGLAPDTYRLGFEDPGTGAFVAEFFDDARTVRAGTDIVVGASTTVSGRNAQLTRTSRITGTVTAVGGAPLAGIVVTSFALEDGFFRQFDSTTTSATGTYTLSGLRGGVHRVGFRDSSATYLDEFFDNATTFPLARDIAVPADGAQVAGINAQLALAGHITGRLTTSTGAAIAGAEATAYLFDDVNGSWDRIRSGTSTADGSYDIGGLRPETYRIGFEGDDGGYLPEFFDNAPTLKLASDVPVGAAATVTGRNAVLADGGRITGTVTRPGGVPAGTATVRAFRADEPGGPFRPVASDFAADNGSYVLKGLPTGTYRVEFRDDSNDDIVEYWNNATTLATGTDIGVTAGATVTGISAEIAAVTGGTGAITGTVTGGGAPIQNVEVRAFRVEGDDLDFVRSTSTSATGTYTLSQLAPGSYLVRFDDSNGRLDEFFDNAPTSATATPTTVTAGATVPGRNADLEAPSSITGVVTDAAGPVDDLEVAAFTFDTVDQRWRFHASTFTNSTGAYVLDDLRAGTYRLRFRDFDNRHITEFFDDKGRVELAADIVVPNAATVAGKNAFVTIAAHIKGRVTSSAGLPLRDITVVAYQRQSGSNFFGETSVETKADGTYDLEGLGVGTYRLEFRDDSGQHVGEFFNNVATLGSAVDVVIASSADVTGRDAVLAPASSISGTVRDAAGNPIIDANARADLFVRSGTEWVFRTRDFPDDTGAFVFSGLAAGTYAIGYSASGFVQEFYDNVATLEAATPIVVGTDQDVAGKDAVLAAGATITGTVTDPDGLNAVGVAVTAFRVDGGFTDFAAQRFVRPNGRYFLPGLAAGTYRLRFSDPENLYATEFWNNAASLDTATDIVVAAGSTVSGRDAQLVDAGSITGTVRAGAVPLNRVTVEAYTNIAGTWRQVDAVATEVDGTYTIDGLLPGTYRIGFDDAVNNHAVEFWNNVGTLSAATDIAVAAGAASAGRDADLAVGARITGTLTSAGAVPLSGARITAFSDDGLTTRESITNASGQYEVRGLAAGTYRLRFVAADHRPEFFDNAETSATATPVTVTSGATVTGRNAELARDAQLSGVVTDDAGLPLADVGVAVLQLASNGAYFPAGFDQTEVDGSWSTALDPGTYRVEIVDQAGYYVPEFFEDVATIDQAVDITVVQSGVRTGIDTSLTRVDARPVIRNTALPTITGAPSVGSPLMASTGSWTPSTGLTFAYQWLRNTAPIAGATAATYTPVSADLGQVLRVVVTASKAGRTPGSATSDPSAPVSNQPPVRNTAPPVVSGDAVVGGTLTTTNGSWNPATELAFAYQWLADDAVIVGATASTYSPVAGDVGKTIKVRVTASRAGHTSGTATSAATSPVVQLAVVNTSPPTITGNAVVGSTLRASDGTWNPSSGLTFAYQWLANDAPIAGATTATYTPVNADLGKVIKVRVTASRPLHTSATATSSGTAAVVMPTVTNTAVPTITGSAAVGATLSATNGTWNPDTGLTFAYQWLANDAPIAGATAATYNPVAADLGKPIKVRVTASRAGHTSGTATSAATAPVSNQPPVTNTAAPVVSGNPVVGNTLSATPGTWNPATGLTFAYQWLANDAAIAGATTTTYTLVSGDVGKTIKVRVTASRTGNTNGTATSAPTAAVTLPRVTNTAVPTITGSASVGATLSATNGTWNPATGLAFAYQWSAAGVAIDGANSSTYSPVTADIGKTITVRVTASRDGHTSGTATSAATAPVTAQEPPLTNVGPPTITGRAKVGKTLTASNGTWNPATGLTFTYQWKLSGTAQSGATSSTYVLPASAIRKTVTVTVTATRGSRTESATSAATAPVKAGTLRLVSGPKITGTLKVGKTLTATPGTTNPAATKVKYQWLRNGTAIAKATTATYKLTTKDKGKKISVKVTHIRAGYTALVKTAGPTGAIK